MAPMPRKSPVDCLRDRIVIMGYDFVIEVMRRIDTEAGFKALLRRWMVERTFGWLIRWRRACATTNHASTSPSHDPRRRGQSFDAQQPLNQFPNGLLAKPH